MARYKFIILFLIVVFGHLTAFCQDSDTESTVEVTTEESNSDGSDSVLYYNQKYVSKDSIQSYKHAKSFAYTKNLDSLLKSMQKQEQSNVTFQPAGKSWIERFFESPITRLVFWILAGLFILMILYKLFFTKGFFQRQTLQSNVAELAEEEEVSIHADYDKLIAGAVAAKDYRLAVRYLYLQVLQRLTKSGAIIFSADKTNYQYLREIGAKSYRDKFSTLTLNYEYVWYGEFEIDELIFSKLQTEFKQFQTLV